MKLSEYDLLYDLPAGEYDGRGVDGVRTVTIRAGRSLEVMCCPIIKVGPQAREEAKRRRTTPAMAKINARNTERKIMRYLEAEFTENAVVITGTYAYPMEDYGMCNLRELADSYDERGLPWDVERVNMDKRNFIDRVKRRVVKAGGKAKDLKWIVRIEEGKEPPAEGLPPKYHIHGIFEGPGVTKELLEELWPHGWAKTDPFRVTDDGPATLARYLCKQRRGGRWWSHSRNLRLPTPTVSERKVSRRRLSRIAADVQRDGREILEKIYPGYKLVEATVHYSDYVAGAYIYARMRARPEAGGHHAKERRRE